MTNRPADPAKASYALALQRLRRRRRFLWGVVLAYLPAILAAYRFTGSVGGSMPVFFAWFVLLWVAAFAAALVRCPRCGNYFHMHGMTLLFWRRCLHCQLHVCADKRGE